MSAQLSLRLDLWPDLFAHRPSALHLVAALGTAVFICNAREAREWARETIAGDNVREPHSFSWRSRARGTGQRCPRRLTGSQATGAARTAASSLSESSVPTRARRRIQAQAGRQQRGQNAGRKRSASPFFLFRSGLPKNFLCAFIFVPRIVRVRRTRGGMKVAARIGEKLRREIGHRKW